MLVSVGITGKPESLALFILQHAFATGAFATNLRQNRDMKTWFITGTSSGLGRHLAETVLRNGDQCVLTARRPEQVEDLTSLFGHAAIALRLDVTEPASITAALKNAQEHFGTIDIIVNNAGQGLLSGLEETDDSLLARNLETNLLGPIRVMRMALPIFREQRGGHFINISAAAAISNYAGFGIYGAAKAGLEAASEAVALEAASFGVKVTLVVPGPFRTDFVSRSVEFATHQPEYAATVGKFETLLKRMNGRQPGDPARAAAAIYQIAHAEQPPFRLVLGKYAVQKMEKKIAALQNELNAWRTLGESTDGAV